MSARIKKRRELRDAHEAEILMLQGPAALVVHFETELKKRSSYTQAEQKSLSRRLNKARRLLFESSIYRSGFSTNGNGAD